jgi:hypothetical protein
MANATLEFGWMNAAEWLRRHPGVFGKDTFYARLRDGSIPCVKAGRKILVREDLLDLMMQQASKGGPIGL